MQRKPIQRILGLLLMLFSLTMIPPGLVALIYGESLIPFVDGMVWILLLGLVFYLPVRRSRRELRTRDGFMVVALFWTALGTSGSIPLLLSSEELGITDAVFESISGLTTTGATVLIGLDELPRSILFYRSQLQWLGGMGIIVLAVAILPMLGIGGMQLYRAETPGPIKENRLTPRITETAKTLWYVYLGLTVLCGLSYWLAGMSGFDAINHSFTTIAIGGFSTHDASMGYFNNRLIELVAIVFMFIAGINFALHYIAARRISFDHYRRDSEFRFYALVLSMVALLAGSYLFATHSSSTLDAAMIEGLFQTVSIGTTTGFTTAEYHNWPGFLPILLLLTSFIGGCAGSTAGGIKVIRFLLLYKQGMREINRLLHPNAVIAVKLGKKPVSPRVMEAVWGFFVLYMGCFALLSLLLAATGIDLVTSFSAVAASLNNLGPGLGEVGTNYSSINDLAKWILCLAMLLGRLEIFALLVLFTPAYWRG
jgi:trk system potassium uptake protein TrkH